MKLNRRILTRVATALTSTAIFAFGLAPARADVQIEFDLSGSQFSAFGGAVELSSSAYGGPASARITVPGDASGIQDGVATIEDFTLPSVQVNANLFDLIALNGSASAQQIGMAVGQLTDQGNGDVIVSPAMPLALDTQGSVVCTPAQYCAALGGFPLDLTGSHSFAPLSFSVQDLDVAGAASVNGRIELEFDGQSAFIDLVGTEVDRIFVPEPAIALQVCSGFLCLMGLHGVSIRRRARAV